MTIAIGMMTQEGIVIAADSQEGSGYAGEIKTPVEKVFTRSCVGVGTVAITGAGTGGYIDAAAQFVADEFAATPIGDMEAKFRERTEEFYQKHIIPLYQYQKERGNPDIDLIIGADFGASRLLLANTGTMIRRCHDYVAVGAGARHASILLSRTFFWTLPIERALLLAAYAVFSAKENVEGCGKHTDLYMLKGGQCWRMLTHDCLELDRRFEQYSSFESIIIHHLFGRTGGIENDLKYLDIIRQKILEIVPSRFALVEPE